MYGPKSHDFSVILSQVIPRGSKRPAAIDRDAAAPSYLKSYGGAAFGVMALVGGAAFYDTYHSDRQPYTDLGTMIWKGATLDTHKEEGKDEPTRSDKIREDEPPPGE